MAQPYFAREQMSHDASDSLKKKLVEDIAAGLLPTYNYANGSSLCATRMGKPPEPDLICLDTLTMEQIGIEVTVAYYDHKHAKAVWEPARRKSSAPYHLTRQDHEENIRVLAHAAGIIRRKGKKRYTSPGRLLLTVLIYSDRFYLCDHDVEERLRTFRIPSAHPFDEILVFSQHGELYQLFPERRWVFQ